MGGGDFCSMTYFLSLLASLYFVLCPMRADEVVQPQLARVAPEMVKAAHQYHGIRLSIGYPDGSTWFYRKGEWCRLYTKSFLRQWRKDNEVH